MVLDPKRFISDVTNFILNFEKINIVKSTEVPRALRPSIDFVSERSIGKGNLKNIRKGKDEYSGVKHWGSNKRISCQIPHLPKSCGMDKIASD
jgi:hypothetical protein